MTGYQHQTHLPNVPRWYVADLPGCNGIVRIKVGDGRRSDWGWTTDPAKAIQLTPYWQKRFLAFCRWDFNRLSFGLL